MLKTSGRAQRIRDRFGIAKAKCSIKSLPMRPRMRSGCVQELSCFSSLVSFVRSTRQREVGGLSTKRSQAYFSHTWRVRPVAETGGESVPLLNPQHDLA